MCPAGRLENQRKSSYCMCHWKRKQRNERENVEEKENVDEEVEVQKREKLAVEWVNGVWWWSVCGHQCSVCAVHMVFWHVCVCVCSPTIKLRWSPLMCQTTGSHHTLPCHIRRVCSVPVGPPSIHPPIHNIQRLIPSLCCRAGSPEEGWGGQHR